MHTRCSLSRGSPAVVTAVLERLQSHSGATTSSYPLPGRSNPPYISPAQPRFDDVDSAFSRELAKRKLSASPVELAEPAKLATWPPSSVGKAVGPVVRSSKGARASRSARVALQQGAGQRRVRALRSHSSQLQLGRKASQHAAAGLRSAGADQQAQQQQQQQAAPGRPSVAVEEQQLYRDIEAAQQVEAAWQQLSGSWRGAQPPQREHLAATLRVLPAELEARRQRGAAARAALADSCQAMVVHLARRYASLSGLDYQDLYQEGRLALQRAAATFDAGQGLRFASYAFIGIEREMIRIVRAQKDVVRIPAQHHSLRVRAAEAQASLTRRLGRAPNTAEVAAALRVSEQRLALVLRHGRIQTSLDSMAVSSAKGEEVDPAESIVVGDTDDAAKLEDASWASNVDREFQIVLEAVLGSLAPAEAAVLRLLFGLDDGRPRTLAEAAAVLRMSAASVRQARIRALAKLRATGRLAAILPYAQAVRGGMRLGMTTA